MPSLCDANVLLAICHNRHTLHEKALQWLDSITNDGEIIVCRWVQLALLRLLNNPVTMQGMPRTVKQAWIDYDMLMSDGRFIYFDEPEQLESVLRSLMDKHQYAPKLWPDAYLAAFALSGKSRLVTFDRGFRNFAGLDLVLLGYSE
jgi:uncharacterized protein